MTDGPRVQQPDRQQLYWDMVDLESQIEPDHLARVVWAFVAALDVPELYAAIRARDDVAGRPTPDPKVLLALWLYATADGVGSARALERLCQGHAAYRWLRGGVPVNYHGLSDFRSAHGPLLDRVLTESVTSLAAEGLVSLDEVAIDGTKVAANAGRGSFRDAERLVRFEVAARARMERLRADLEADPGVNERRRRAAGERAGREVAARAEAARQKLAALQEEKRRRAETHAKEEAEKKAPQASTSDPDARIMKMADGGFRPAYNLLLAAAPKEQIVLGVAATDRRNETGLATPMVEQLAQRYGRRPTRLLLDTKLSTQEEIEAFAGYPRPIDVYSPPPPDKADATAETVRKRAWLRRREPPALREWRDRMASPEGALVYARRRLIETLNGQLKNHGLRRLYLRSFAKVRCELLLHAIAHNLRRARTLRLAAAA